MIVLHDTGVQTQDMQAHADRGQFYSADTGDSESANSDDPFGETQLR